MRAILERVAGTLVAVVATVLLAGLSRVPWAAERSEGGALRLAWQFRSEPVERCRAVSPEENANLPVHMRRETICERGLRSYALSVALDGRPAVADTVAARGASADRPLAVFRELRLAPGPHRFTVGFAPVGGGAAELALDTVVTVGPRQVWLVTYDEDHSGLVLRDRVR